jgi:hypothetical protein
MRYFSFLFTNYLVQLSVATLAVAFRSYVTSLTRSKARDVCNRVTETYHRWQSAEKYLSPMIEFLPQLLIVSILLFVIGLIDNLFSISVSLDGSASQALFTASKACSAVFGTVVFILACTILHAIFRPLHSPFASTLTKLIIQGYMHALRGLRHGLNILWLGLPETALTNRIGTVSARMLTHIIHLEAYGDVSTPQSHHITAYGNLMSQTYDESLLDDGLSALKEMLQLAAQGKTSARSMMELVAYLFTPAASRRSAMTAARSILDYRLSGPGKQT